MRKKWEQSASSSETLDDVSEEEKMKNIPRNVQEMDMPPPLKKKQSFKRVRHWRNNCSRKRVMDPRHF